MKVLFLDFDGVICFGTLNNKPIDYLIPDCIAQLNRIMKEVPDLKIVISSTWRVLSDFNWITNHMEEAGFNYIKRVIGVTPSLSKIPQVQGVSRPESRGLSTWVDRGWEIQGWLDKNPKATKFAILDDDSDMVHLDKYFIQTTFDEGLTEEMANKVIDLLI